MQNPSILAIVGLLQLRYRTRLHRIVINFHRIFAGAVLLELRDIRQRRRPCRRGRYDDHAARVVYFKSSSTLGITCHISKVMAFRLAWLSSWIKPIPLSLETIN